MLDDLIAGRPSGSLVTSLKHRISFLYFEYARVVKSENSLVAVSGEKWCDIPAANLTVLMLGPGTSITHDALMELSRWNCSVVVTAGNGLGYYSALNTSSGSNAKFILRQAEIVSDKDLRMSVVRSMYSLRWGGASFASEASLKELMAFEGRRMKSVYRDCAKKYGVDKYRRVQDVDFDSDDTLNQLITSGNAMLYGLVSAVCVGLGVSPSLGFIHHGHTKAFVFDIADFYKETLVIPLAFELYSKNAEMSQMRKEFRKKSSGLNLVPDIVEKIYAVLGFAGTEDAGSVDFDTALALWSGENLLFTDGYAVPMGTK